MSTTPNPSATPEAPADHEVSPVGYPDLVPGTTAPAPAGLELLADVDLVVSVELGRTRLALRDVLRLVTGSVLELNRAASAPVDVLVNGSPVARGEVVVVDDELGVRITELLPGS